MHDEQEDADAIVVAADGQKEDASIYLLSGMNGQYEPGGRGRALSSIHLLKIMRRYSG